MSLAVEHERWISPEEYLAAEADSPDRHEYVGGEVYAMAGGETRHHIISMNVQGELFGQLKGKHCRPFNGDAKVRIRLIDHDVFYYPDAMVICGIRGQHEVFVESPSIVFEVVSPASDRIDRREKAAAYRTIPTLEAYIIVETAHIGLTVHRRTADGWVIEYLKNRKEVLPLPGVGCELSLAAIYVDSEL